MAKKEYTTDQPLKEFDSSMFELVNNDPGKKIHDERLQTKPTTFAKDALKRFAKNKSSVVGAVIIGLLLLGSFISIFSPNDIKSAHTDERLLPEKLFDAGTGWWDGTHKYYNVAYDDINGVPYGFKENAILSSSISGEQFADQYYEFAKGGYMRVTSKKPYSNPDKNINNANYTTDTFNYYPFELSAAKEVTLKVTIGNELTVREDAQCDLYAIKLDVNGTTYVLQDFTNEFGKTYEINISQFMNDNGIADSDKCYLHFYGRPHVSENYEYLLIKDLYFSSTDEELQAKYDTLNIVDANYTSGLGPDGENKFPLGFWRSTGTKTSYQAVYKTVNFVYDEYEALFGDRVDVIGGSLIQTYINNGWCEMSDFNDISTFHVIDAEKCPVKEMYSVDTSGGVYQFKCLYTYYKYKGYDNPPKYLFGTDAMGHDLLTVAFSSLKTSLLVAIIASATCLIIGLIWGSISGYFGGNVDIIMERITDILGGVPWIVMMTLIILLLGNNVVTFAIALIMTGWISTASRTRTQFYRFKGREYILASRTLGASDARLIFRHILPNGSGTIVTGSVLMIPGCIFSEASISYLGLGLQGVDSFGVLLAENQTYLSTRPLLVIIPSIIISLLMISFNLFGNGLRDALNPTLKGGE